MPHVPPATIADHGPGGVGAATAQPVVLRCTSAEERNRWIASDYVAEFNPLGPAPYRSGLAGLDVAGVRVTAVRDEGGVRMRAAWRDDALGAVFLWGLGARVDRAAHALPQLVIAGPGTEVMAVQQGPCRNLRVGLRGPALRALCDDPATARAVRPWLVGGIFRPRTAAAAEWRLQQKILHCARFAEQAAARNVDVERALAVAADEVTALLLDVLRAADDADGADRGDSSARRRLVRRALDILDVEAEAPVSVANTCRQLQVSERTLQRAFQETLGIGLRAYERARRLRGAHGMILAEGDRRSVTDIAMSFGFWHLGRFAGAYTAMFGCSPSETRRRVWHHPR